MQLGPDSSLPDAPKERAKRVIWNILFVTLVVAISALTLSIVFAPAEKVAGWLQEKKTDLAQKVQLSTKKDGRDTAANGKHISLKKELILTQLDNLGEEKPIADQLLRGRRIALIEAAVKLDKQANLQRQMNIVEFEISAINKKIGAQKQNLADGENRIASKVRMNELRAQAKESVMRYNEATRNVRNEIEAEKSRRLDILNSVEGAIQQ